MRISSRLVCYLSLLAITPERGECTRVAAMLPFPSGRPVSPCFHLQSCEPACLSQHCSLAGLRTLGISVVGCCFCLAERIVQRDGHFVIKFCVS